MVYGKKETEYIPWHKLNVWAAWAVIASAVMSAGCGKLDKALPISMSTDEAVVAEWLAQESAATQGGAVAQGNAATQGGAVAQGNAATQGGAVAQESAASQDGAVVQGNAATQDNAGADITAQSAGQPTLIYVHVCGAVRQAGVVVLPMGSRGKDALEAAGGFAEDADREAVNLASMLYDGQKLYFPTEGEEWAGDDIGQAVLAGQLGAAGSQVSTGGLGAAGSQVSTGGQGSAGQVAASGLVNINTADEALLCTLPGIGETRAKAIISYREQKGSFGKIEDIMKVSGIKEGAFGKIKELITVN